MKKTRETTVTQKQRAIALVRFIGRNFITAVFLLIFVSLQVPVRIFAQTMRESGIGGSPMMMMDQYSLEDIAKLELAYSRLATEALSKYFPENRYIIGVKIQADSRSTEVSSTVVTKKIEQPNTLNLPALPVLPDELRKNRSNDQSEQESHYKTSLFISSIMVTAIIDSGFTRPEEDLLMSVVRLAINLSDARGDRVTTMRKKFPKPAALPEPTRMNVDLSSPAAQPSSADTTELSSIDFTVIGLVFALLVGLLLMIRKNNVVAAEQKVFQRSTPVLNTTSPLEGLQSMNIKMSQEAAEEKPPAPMDFGDEDKDAIYQLFVNDAKSVARFVAGKMSDGGGNEQKQFAAALRNVDLKLLMVLKNELPEEIYNHLEGLVNNVAEETPGVMLEYIRTMRKEIEHALGVGDMDRSGLALPGFTFLQRMTPAQLKILFLQVNQDNTKALIISQIGREKSKIIFNELDPEKAAAIIALIPMIKQIDIRLWKKMEQFLFEKSIQIIQQDTYAKKESKAILTILSSLPVKNQWIFFQQLQSHNPALAEIIRNEYTFFEDLPEIDSEIIEKAVASLSSETLIRALWNIDPLIKDILLNTRLPREREMIEQDLQSGVPAEEADTEKARQEILAAIASVKKGAE
jgi:flagellar motor switch protein FliG